jgi:hypothetical protein
MRKKIWIPAALIAAAALGFFGFAPGYVEGSMNQIDGKPLIAVSPEAKALHKTLGCPVTPQGHRCNSKSGNTPRRAPAGRACAP